MPVSRIFTSEPMATRALAAEIRNDPDAFVALLESVLQSPSGSLGTLTAIACESDARIDVLLTFASPAGQVRVGIEAKFGHELTSAQIEKEERVVDHLVLLLVDANDRSAAYAAIPAFTWEEALKCFDRPRLTPHDIVDMPLSKVTIERKLRAQPLEKLLGPGWMVDIRRGGGGMPSIVIQSPPLPDERQLRGQIQVIGRGMPANPDRVQFEFHVGVQVNADENDLPHPDVVPTPPPWIGHLRALETVIESRPDLSVRVSRTSARNGNSSLGRNKIPLLQAHLPGRSWLGKGYTDGWALGVKSVPCGVDDLPDLCAHAAELFTAWFDAVSENRH